MSSSVALTVLDSQPRAGKKVPESKPACTWFPLHAYPASVSHLWKPTMSCLGSSLSPDLFFVEDAIPEAKEMS